MVHHQENRRQVPWTLPGQSLKTRGPPRMADRPLCCPQRSCTGHHRPSSVTLTLIIRTDFWKKKTTAILVLKQQRSAAVYQDSQAKMNRDKYYTQNEKPSKRGRPI